MPRTQPLDHRHTARAPATGLDGHALITQRTRTSTRIFLMQPRSERTMAMPKDPRDRQTPPLPRPRTTCSQDLRLRHHHHHGNLCHPLTTGRMVAPQRPPPPQSPQPPPQHPTKNHNSSNRITLAPQQLPLPLSILPLLHRHPRSARLGTKAAHQLKTSRLLRRVHQDRRVPLTESRLVVAAVLVAPAVMPRQT